MEILSRAATGSLDALAGTAGRTAFLAGACGTGMRGLGLLLLENGWQVWGSDLRAPVAGDPLLERGLRFLEAGEPPPRVSLAIRSAAVPPGHPQFRAAAGAGARSLRYAEALGAISTLRPVLAVAGSHGKTTCTAWIAWGLRRAGRRCGWLVGGSAHQLPATACWGDPGEPLVLESCEYDRSFHALAPAEVALTNVDAEHPDTYPGGIEEVRQAFRRFLARVPASGRVFAGPEVCPSLREATRARWRPAAPLPARTPVGLAGAHNRRNGALVAAVLRGHGLEGEAVGAALAGFRGVARRLEVVGQRQGAPVVSDYAHHPAEVAATLEAARDRWPEAHRVVVFQPHQATRFQAYRERFAAALEGIAALLLLEIYRVRDPDELQPSVAELLPLLSPAVRARARVVDEEAALARLVELASRDAVLLFLGAGDVDGLARRFVSS